MNPGLSWRPASAASEFPFSFEVFDICIWCPKQRTHRPDLPVVGQHQFQSIESCARLTILTHPDGRHPAQLFDNSSNKGRGAKWRRSVGKILDRGIGFPLYFQVLDTWRFKATCST